MIGQSLHVVTYNIHKGFSQFNRHMMVHELRENLRGLSPDIVFLQEVQGDHRRHAVSVQNWPELPQHEFLAEDMWAAKAYGRNMVYGHGHHGNAILSKFHIVSSHNQDVTHFKFERRGLLHSRVQVPGVAEPVHCVCVHLSLFARSRRKQLDSLSHYLESFEAHAPLIIAGDFNDWRNEAATLLAKRLGLREVFSGADDVPTRSFPSIRPFLRLDRIYVRGFSVAAAQVLKGGAWGKISDHAPLSARLVSETRR